MWVQWHIDAWNDYVEWAGSNKAVTRKINSLVKELSRSDPKRKPIGQAERLSNSKHGLCSARIDKANRLCYKLTPDVLYIVSCKGHYGLDEDKLDL